MAFRFRCPACNAVLSAAEDLAGVHITCAMCEAVLEVPKPPKKAAAAPPKKEGSPGPAAPAKQEASETVADEAALGFRGRKRPPDDEMDMTPMVDVTFLLLIFFMITAAFSMQKSFEVPTPNDAKTTAAARTLQDFENDPNFVVVRIDSQGTFSVTAAEFVKETPSRGELLAQLKLARQGNKSGVVPTRMLVVAHGEAEHEKVVFAIDAGTAVGMEEVKMLTVEGDE